MDIINRAAVGVVAITGKGAFGDGHLSAGLRNGVAFGIFIIGSISSKNTTDDLGIGRTGENSTAAVFAGRSVVLKSASLYDKSRKAIANSSTMT